MELKELSNKLVHTEQQLDKLVQQFNLLRGQFWAGQMPVSTGAAGETSDDQSDDLDVNQSCDQRSNSSSYRHMIEVSHSVFFSWLVLVVENVSKVLRSNRLSPLSTHKIDDIHFLFTQMISAYEILFGCKHISGVCVGRQHYAPTLFTRKTIKKRSNDCTCGVFKDNHI